MTKTSTIDEYRALKGMPKSDEALKLLREIGEIVQPIMMKHRWRLPLLVEIYPKQESLLGFNVNNGSKIALRLRQSSNKMDFIDQASIVETMLHELAHNYRGPHDDIFYKHLDTLTMEWYYLQRNNNMLPGQGFLSEGNRLGGANPERQIDLSRARQKAVEMAEKRRKLGEIMKGGGRVLGGNPSPESLAAARADAAERRRAITSHCPSGSTHEIEVAAQEQAEEELLHGIQVITIDDDDDDGDIIDEEAGFRSIGKTPPASKIELTSSDEDEIVIVDIKRAPKRAALPSSTSSTSTPSHLVKQTRAAASLRQNLLTNSGQIQNFQQGLAPSSSSDITNQSKAWNCQRCTLRNHQSSLVCNACDDIRPGLPAWTCSNCHHRMLGDFAQFWLCTKCSQLKTA